MAVESSRIGVVKSTTCRRAVVAEKSDAPMSISLDGNFNELFSFDLNLIYLLRRRAFQ